MEQNFKRFLDNILLTQKQSEDARIKYNGVCEVLHKAYYPNTSYNGSTKFLIGSYGKSTNIRPPRDIDVIFKMPDAEFQRFDSLSGNKQSQLLQEIKEVLKGSYTTTEEIKAWGKVVVISFAEGTHTVELLPAWQLDNRKFKIPNTENGGAWNITDPISEMDNISSSNKKTGITLDFIRIIKKWVENSNVELPSFIIEILVVNYLNGKSTIDLKEGFAKLTLDFFPYLLKLANTTLIRPTQESYFLGEKWQSKAETACQRALKGKEFEDKGKYDESADEWKKIFGDDFPKLSIQKSVADDYIQSLRNLYHSMDEEYLDKTYNIPFELNPNYSVKIDSYVPEVKGFQANSLRILNKMKLFRLVRKMHLSFRIVEISNNITGEYQVRWKVRNFGEEAQSANDLRGEISIDTGNNEKKEHTRYMGDHYIECYIIQNGKCVAMDKILVPIGSND